MRILVVAFLVLSVLALPALADETSEPAPAGSSSMPSDGDDDGGTRWEGVDASAVENPQEWCPGG